MNVFSTVRCEYHQIPRHVKKFIEVKIFKICIRLMKFGVRLVLVFRNGYVNSYIFSVVKTSYSKFYSKKYF